MRKLFIILAVVFATSVLAMPSMGASTACPTKHMKKHSMMHHKYRHHHRTCYKVTKMHCRRVRHHKAKPAQAARGPVVTCPAPVVNVPQQAAPVVNVPQQAAPVVNVAAPPPGVGITTDNTSIYIVRGNHLMVLDKCTFEVKKTVNLE